MIGYLPDHDLGDWDAVTTVPELTRVVTGLARAALDAHGATFVLREGDKCFYAAEDSASPLWAGQRFPASQCISGWAMQHGRSAVVGDIETDPRIPVEAYRPTFVRSLVMCPVGRPEARAAIGAYWAYRHQPAESTRAALEQIADATAIVLDRIGLAGAPWAPTFSDRGGVGPGVVERGEFRVSSELGEP